MNDKERYIIINSMLDNILEIMKETVKLQERKQAMEKTTLKNGYMELEVIKESGEYTMVHRLNDDSWIVAWLLNNHGDGTCDWAQGYYCDNKQVAERIFKDKTGA